METLYGFHVSIMVVGPKVLTIAGGPIVLVKLAGAKRGFCEALVI
jgi:hypothetical protein